MGIQKFLNAYFYWISYKTLAEESIIKYFASTISRVSCQKGPTRHAYAWPIGPFWQDALYI